MAILESRLKYQVRGPDVGHGSRTLSPSWLLILGLLVVSLAGAIKSGKQLGSGVTSMSAIAGAENPGTEQVPAKPDLNATMSAALESVAQRYRVSPEALQPIFFAAQTAAKDVDPLLIIAIIGIESGFNPFAQSVMGAQGLMQVIPRYHRDKLPRDSGNAGFLDPVSNVRVGARVLQEAIRRQGGSQVEGLQYYAGAVDDPDRGYATRVLAEKQRLEQAVRAKKIQVPAAANSPRAPSVPAKETSQKTE